MCYVACVAHSWASSALSALSGELQKTFATMARDHYNADRSRGVFRHDILLPPPPNTPSMQELLPFLQQHRLLAFRRVIDPMHVLENVSQTVHKLLLAALPTKQQQATATALLRKHTGLPVINNNNPSWRWRKVWSCWPVVWRPLLESTHPLLLDVIRALSIATAVLYGAPETRNARHALLLFGAAYTVHSGLVALGAKINLSEHLLWPHMPLQYADVDGHNASCERPEADWKRYKDAHRVTYRNAPDALKQMITRVYITEYVRNRGVVKDRKRTKREEQWAAEEHSVRFVVSRASPEFVNAFLMYASSRDLRTLMVMCTVPSDDTRRVCGGTGAAAAATARASWSCTRVATTPCIRSPCCPPWRAPHAAPSTTTTRRCTRTTSRPRSTPPRANTRPRRPPPLPPPLPAKPCGRPNHRGSSKTSSSKPSHSRRNSRRTNPALGSANAAAARHGARPPPRRHPPPAAPQHRPSPPSPPPPPRAAAPCHGHRRHHNRWPSATHLRPSMPPSPTARCRRCRRTCRTMKTTNPRHQTTRKRASRSGTMHAAALSRARSSRRYVRRRWIVSGCVAA